MKLDLWGFEASPFLLKVEALLNCRGIEFRRLPRDGGRGENLLAAVRLIRARHAGRIRRYPAMDALDEYPSVPFLIVGGRDIQYDSSSIALWLDEQLPSDAPPFYPLEPVAGFLARLIDEAFDEYGLYMVHHQRWVCSAADNVMGETTAGELSRLLPPFSAANIARKLSRRQVRRCPYLFSVAPAGFKPASAAGLAAERVPPSLTGFPPTHALLEQSWGATIVAMEQLLAAQPYVLGNRFTLADASIYGQLSMNLIDPTTARNLMHRAPRTYQWLLDIRDARHRGSAGELFVSPALQPLLQLIMASFAPLMVQNEQAYQRAVAGGETVFNEAAFDRGLALYDGELQGHPFRAVVKTFQVVVWRELRQRWSSLEDSARDELKSILPDSHWLCGDDSAQGLIS